MRPWRRTPLSMDPGQQRTTPQGRRAAPLPGNAILSRTRRGALRAAPQSRHPCATGKISKTTPCKVAEYRPRRSIRGKAGWWLRRRDSALSPLAACNGERSSSPRRTGLNAPCSGAGQIACLIEAAGQRTRRDGRRRALGQTGGVRTFLNAPAGSRTKLVQPTVAEAGNPCSSAPAGPRRPEATSLRRPPPVRSAARRRRGRRPVWRRRR